MIATRGKSKTACHIPDRLGNFNEKSSYPDFVFAELCAPAPLRETGRLMLTQGR
jgi:hypothetical protein